MSQLILYKRPAPDSPETEQITIYAKTDGKVYSKDNSGFEYLLSNDLTTILDHEAAANPHPQYVLKVNLQKTEYRTITQAEVDNKQLLLAFTPLDPSSVQVDMKHGGGPLFLGEDFIIDGNLLKWGGCSLDSFISENDKLRIVYTCI